MTKAQIQRASIETLNARREELANAHGILQAEKLHEWKMIDREVQSRNTYQEYEMSAWAYTRQITQYQPSPIVSDGQ